MALRGHAVVSLAMTRTRSWCSSRAGRWLALLLVPTFALHAAPIAAVQVKTAEAGCKNAYAILGWSMFDKQAAAAKTKEEKEYWEDKKKQPWIKVGWILGRRKYLKHVETPEEGVAQQVSFRQYHVKDKDGASGYVAQCGAGLTCNEVALVFHRIYQGIGTPQVQCGPLPAALIDPFKPEIPIPSDEELAKTDYDSSDSGDDDDDDDDKKKDDAAKKDKAKKGDDDDDDDDDAKDKGKSKGKDGDKPKDKEKPKDKDKSKDDDKKKGKGKDKDDDDDDD